MRVLQLIDSLRPGGAERMAVTLANSLSGEVEFSGICVSRKEGILKSKIKPEVSYFFLAKEGSLDFKAFSKLQKYIQNNNVNILHAHGTSFFMGFVIKIINPKIRLIWHDHYGKRATENISSFPVLKMASFFFNGIIVVNRDLLCWAKANLKCKKVIFLPNFVSSNFLQEEKNFIAEHLNIDLVYVANLKEPKNHLNLLAAFKIVLKRRPESFLYLIGENFNDLYSQKVLEFINKNNFQDKVILTGKVTNVSGYLKNAKMGIISSNSEGLPMALIEYGMAGLAVITTDVGACKEVIGKNGKVVEMNDPVGLADNIIFYFNNEEQRKKDAKKLSLVIKQNFSDKTVIPRVKKFYSLVNNSKK